MKQLTDTLEFLLEVYQVLAVVDTKVEVREAALVHGIRRVCLADGHDGRQAISFLGLLDGLEARHDEINALELLQLNADSAISLPLPSFGL